MGGSKEDELVVSRMRGRRIKAGQGCRIPPRGDEDVLKWMVQGRLVLCTGTLWGFAPANPLKWKTSKVKKPRHKTQLSTWGKARIQSSMRFLSNADFFYSIIDLKNSNLDYGKVGDC